MQEDLKQWPKPSHSLAITGYSIVGNKLYFDVYDPAISMAPLRVGGRHLMEHIGTAAIDLCVQGSDLVNHQALQPNSSEAI